MMIMWMVECPSCRKETVYIVYNMTWGRRMNIECMECKNRLDIRPIKEYWDELWDDLQALYRMLKFERG